MPDLYTGTTKSGKTTLARWAARTQVPAGKRIIVRDPVAGTNTAGGGWPERAEVYNDDTKFFERLIDLIEEGIDEKDPVYVFIDEAGDILNNGRPENWWLATRGRHYHLIIAFITQRPKLLSPSVRSQCDRIFMFRLARKDRAEVLAECGHDNSTVDSTEFRKGDFIYMRTDRPDYQRKNVFLDILKVPIPME